jgi:hypothetical protein
MMRLATEEAGVASQFQGRSTLHEPASVPSDLTHRS